MLSALQKEDMNGKISIYEITHVLEEDFGFKETLNLNDSDKKE